MAPLIIVSGPSGSGKSTIVKCLLEEAFWPMRLSVSVTTRSPRPGEIDGTHYHFRSVADFVKDKDAGKFLEWAKVHDNYYGTPESEVTPYREKGVGVLLDIDVQGAAQVRNFCPDAASIFIRTTRFETLEERLQSRRTDSAETIQRRIKNAQAEIDRANEYDYQVINDDLETALASVRKILGPLFERNKHAG